MEIKENQLLKVNCITTDWNQSLVKLWLEYGHQTDLKEELTGSKLNDTRMTMTPYYGRGDL